MLPTPASFIKRGSHYTRLHHPNTHALMNSWHHTLSQRSRVTNLALALGAFVCACSMLLNLVLWWTASSAHAILEMRSYGAVQESYSDVALPASIRATLAEPRLNNLDHLIVVAGHAIWQGCTLEDRLHEHDWVLEPIQREQQLLDTFVKHIAKGAELALDDPKSLLVFSGGQTRPTSLGTEATSYLRLAHTSGFFNAGYNLSTPFPRATTEAFALDSFQNLLFSVARFHEATGGWPKRITVVGFEAKRARFEELHVKALRWNRAQWKYVGIGPERGSLAEGMFAGERQHGYAPYSRDLYGCHVPLLDKRRKRNPFARVHPYHTSAPALRGLLEWCPTAGDMTRVFGGTLPWDTGR